jgi:hypothetical protein
MSEDESAGAGGPIPIRRATAADLFVISDRLRTRAGTALEEARRLRAESDMLRASVPSTFD